MLVGVRRQGEEIIDVAPDVELLRARARRRVHGVLAPEDASVEGTLLQPGGAGRTVIPGYEPRKDGALPPAPRLCHPVHGLLHAAETIDAVGLLLGHHLDRA
eukprot:1739741-Prymnesium_polylepis.1